MTPQSSAVTGSPPDHASTDRAGLPVRLLDWRDVEGGEQAERISLRCSRRRGEQDDPKVGAVDPQHVAVQVQK